jgi:N-acetyl-anhydromuramyl-L-alanine amidase AmpD
MTVSSKRVPPEDWPYEDADPFDVPIKEPSWECPDGTCACHPVEEGEPREIRILLLDELGREMPGARCRVLSQGRILNEDQPNANGEGWLSVTVTRPIRLVTLEWAPQGTPLGPKYPFRKRYHADLKEEDDRLSLRRRLHNLGFSRHEQEEDNVKEFQRTFGYEEITGAMEDIREDLLKFHDEGGFPPLDGPDEEVADGEQLAAAAPFPAFPAFPAFPPAGTAAKTKEPKKKKSKKAPVPRTPPPRKHRPAGGPLSTGTGTARPRVRGTLTLRVCSLFAQPAEDAATSCRWGTSDSHPVAGAVIELFDAAMAEVPAFVAANGTPKTAQNGEVKLKIGGLPDGEYVLKLNPPEGHELRVVPRGPITDPATRDAALRPVGPDDAFFNDPPKHTRFRFLEVRITIEKGVVIKDKTRLGRGMQHKDAIVAHGAAVSESESSLLIDWKPDWVQCGFTDGLKKQQVEPGRPERILSPVHFIILHHTDASTPGSTLDHFSDKIHNKFKTGAHYLVDIDGHVIKMAHETVRTFHPGECYWYGLDSSAASTDDASDFEWVNVAVGIEQVHERTRPYPSEQIAGTKNLIERLQAIYGTSRHNVLGHGEIALDFHEAIKGKRPETKRLGRKLLCPGESYDWHILENSGNATKPMSDLINVPHSRYGDFFNQFPGQAINTATDDQTIVPVAIAGLQLTLSELGYFVNLTAKYDEPTRRAVEAFQVRYFSGRFRRDERKQIMDGGKRLANLLTVERMHKVLAARDRFKY